MRKAFATVVPLRVRAAAACAALLALGGCGGDGSDSSPADTTSADPPNLITSSDIAREVRNERRGRGNRFPEAVRTALEFWRDLQYGNYPEAYESLVSEIRTEVPFRRFVKAMKKARGEFLIRPRVQAVEERGDRFTVFLLLQPGTRPAVSDRPLALTLRRTGRRWQVAGDPGSVLGTSAGIRKRKPPPPPEVEPPASPTTPAGD